MIGEDRPGFESPTELLRDRQQASMEHFQAGGIAEVVLLLVGGRGDKVDAGRIQEVRGGMRPGRRLVGAARYGGRIGWRDGTASDVSVPWGVARAALKAPQSVDAVA